MIGAVTNPSSATYGTRSAGSGARHTCTEKIFMSRIYNAVIISLMSSKLSQVIPKFLSRSQKQKLRIKVLDKKKIKQRNRKFLVYIIV